MDASGLVSLERCERVTCETGDAAMLIRMAASRSREFAADRRAAEIAGSPEGLMSALSKLDSRSERSRMQVNEVAGHMYIVNPLRGAGGMASLFSTHPPMEKRIERLRTR